MTIGELLCAFGVFALDVRRFEVQSFGEEKWITVRYDINRLSEAGVEAGVVHES